MWEGGKVMEGGRRESEVQREIEGGRRIGMEVDKLGREGGTRGVREVESRYKSTFISTVEHEREEGR